MDILVYGAGVCGSYIASELFFAKQNVTLLARGERLQYLRENGVMIKNQTQKSWTTAEVPLIENLKPDAYYDAVFVVMKKTDLKNVLPVLEANKKCPFYIFLGNNGQPQQVCKSFSDASRLAFGFPCSAGKIDKGIVYSSHSGKTVLTLGELLGLESARLSDVASLFRGTAIKTVISPNIDAFLKYHTAIVSPLANAIQWADGDMKELASSEEMTGLVVDAFKEGIGVLEALGYPNEPPSDIRRLKMHKVIVTFFLKRMLLKESSELDLRDHAMKAIGEMAELADEFKALKANSSLATPAIDTLYSHSLRP